MDTELNLFVNQGTFTLWLKNQEHQLSKEEFDRLMEMLTPHYKKENPNGLR